MDWKERTTHTLLGKIVTVTVDRPIGYDHNGLIYPINYGFVEGLMGGDGEEQDAYILGVSEPVETFTGQVIGVVRRHNDCEDKLVVASGEQLYHQGEIARAIHFQEQYFIRSIECLLRKSCGVIPFRQVDGQTEVLLVFEHFSQCWSLPKGHMEAGETEEQTAQRELFEETGLQARLIPESRTVTGYALSNGCYKEVVYFLGTATGQIRTREQEVERCRWVARSELPNYLFPDTAAAVEALLEKY